jgi:hypothetical protein
VTQFSDISLFKLVSDLNFTTRAGEVMSFDPHASWHDKSVS